MTRPEAQTESTQTTEQHARPVHPEDQQRRSLARKEYSVSRSRSLARRLRAGDKDAADELVDRYTDQVYLLMRRLGHGHQTSEDLAQETFLSAWRHIGQLRDDGALNGWLYKIAGNVSRVYWRRQKGRRLHDVEDLDVADPSVAGHAAAGHDEELERLREAVETLPWKLRQAVVLHYMQHLTISEAAQAAGIREGTLKSRLSRGLDALRRALADGR